MSLRVPRHNKVLPYTGCSPENVISAKKGAMFFRTGNRFFLDALGNGTWKELRLRTVALYPPGPDEVIRYQHPAETWLKTSDKSVSSQGIAQRTSTSMLKTGWTLLGYTDMSFTEPTEFLKYLRWTFPVPTSSADPVGTENDRSYDGNYFYTKSASGWRRTPLVRYFFPSTDVLGPRSGSFPENYPNPPAVAGPRYTPIPASWNLESAAREGEQTYDDEFFYVKSGRWLRSPLIIYNPSQVMTTF